MVTIREQTEEEQFNYWNGLTKEYLIKHIMSLQKQIPIINISSDINNPKFIIHQKYKPIISKEEGSKT